MNISRETKTLIRNTIFRHLDGISIVSTIHCLQKSGILKYLSENKKCDLISINKKWDGNIGYLNVALRLLSSQGWLNRKPLKEQNNFDFSLTTKGISLIKYCSLYTKLMPWYNYAVKEEYPFIKNISSNDYNFINDYLTLAENNWEIPLSEIENISSVEFQIFKHLNGVLIGPVIVSLARMGILQDIDLLVKFISSNKKGNLIARILSLESWIDISNNNITDQGKYAFSIATAYGVTVSYFQTFIKVEELLFGNPKILLQKTKSGKETHVNRTMNVWGSGGAHKSYFKTIDKIIIETFNQPIDKQPSGIADMGCGDGTFLQHLYKVITTNTLRRKYINNYPLQIIGADINHAARYAARKRLSNSNIPHYVVDGNINDPKSFSKHIETEYNINLKNMLNVRSFLDHNRKYTVPNKYNSDNNSNSTGAFVSQGKMILNSDLEENLIEHFANWKPYIEKHGLLLLELHTISPLLASENIGITIATAYDATHGYTDQYIIEIDIMLKCVKKAGLFVEVNSQRKYPNNDLATISINLLKAKNELCL